MRWNGDWRIGRGVGEVSGLEYRTRSWKVRHGWEVVFWDVDIKDDGLSMAGVEAKVDGFVLSRVS